MQWVINTKENQPYDVYIGRPSQFGNPFRLGFDGTRQEVIDRYENYLYTRPDLIKIIREQLQGKILGCHCYPLSCHGDLLARIANCYQLCMPLHKENLL